MYKRTTLLYGLTTSLFVTLTGTIPATEITSGLNLWLRSDNLNVTGNTVDQWTDRTATGSGIGDNLSQDAVLSDGGPTTVANGVNGFLSVNYGGGGAHSFTGALGISGTQAFSAFTVFKNESSSAITADERIMQFGDITDNNTFRNVALDGNSTAFRYNNGNRIFNEKFTKNQFELGQWSRAAGSNYGQANLSINSVPGTQASAANPNNVATLVDEGYTLGRGTVSASGAAGNFLIGELAEVLLFDRELNAVETDLVEFYLRHRYNLDFQAVDIDGVSSLSSNLSAAPLVASTLESIHDSDNAAMVFQEAASLTLGADLDVNVQGSGSYSTGFDAVGGSIPAGTAVSSYYLNYDTGAGALTTTFTLSFDDPIVGIISGNTSLANSNGILGSGGTSYMTSTAGLEDNSEDLLVLSADAKTLTATLRVGTGFVDQLRIITSSSAIPEPGSASLVLLGAAVLLVTRRAIKAAL